MFNKHKILIYACFQLRTYASLWLLTELDTIWVPTCFGAYHVIQKSINMIHQPIFVSEQIASSDQQSVTWISLARAKEIQVTHFYKL